MKANAKFSGILCEGEEAMCLVGGQVFQGLPVQPQRRVFVRFRANKSGVLGSGRNPTNHHQFPHQDKPWSLSFISPHLDYWVGFLFSFLNS